MPHSSLSPNGSHGPPMPQSLCFGELGGLESCELSSLPTASLGLLGSQATRAALSGLQLSQVTQRPQTSKVLQCTLLGAYETTLFSAWSKGLQISTKLPYPLWCKIPQVDRPPSIDVSKNIKILFLTLKIPCLIDTHMSKMISSYEIVAREYSTHLIFEA